MKLKNIKKIPVMKLWKGFGAMFNVSFWFEEYKQLPAEDSSFGFFI